jgi:hypothetical protein
MISKESTGIAIEYHPQYNDHVEVWQKMRDGQAQRYVKERDDGDSTNSTNNKYGVKVYLPKTSGQSADINNGEKSYQAKKTRAEYPSNLKDTEIAMLGMLSKNKINIELPPALKSLQVNLAANGDDLESLNSRINEQQVIISRCGLFADLPAVENNMIPYVALFLGERIINWNSYMDGEDEKFTYVLLDISNYEMNKKNGKWEWITKYRVLALDENGDYYSYVVDDSNIDLSVVPADAVYPTVNGNKSKEIPFVICNATNTMSDVENPILEELADLALKYYRNDADYQELLFMQTVAIPCFFGLTTEEVTAIKEVGVTNGISSTNSDAKAEFLEVTGAGLSEAAKALEDTNKRMIDKSISLGEAGKNESGEALSIRLTTKTAKLSIISETSTEAIEKIIKIIARWMGITDSEVVISSPNDFTDSTMSIEDIIRLSDSVERGNFTREDLYEILKKAGHTKWQTYEEWVQNTDAVANLDM